MAKSRNLSAMSWNKMKRKMGFFGLMRSLDSAESSFEKIPGGGLKATIHHALLNNVKIKHLVWWFENIDGITTYNGQDFNGLEIDVYRLWHPHDHIKVVWKKKLLSPQGRVLPGSVMRIKETFGGYLIEENALISRFDDEEYNFDFKKFGLKVGELIHAYKEVKGGVKFKTEMTIRCETPIIGGLITWVATKFVMHEKKIKAWIQHNVEESGESEHFIPKLYDHAQSQ